MVGPIERIINQYAPEMKKVLKAEAEKAKEAASAKMEQAANVARTEVKYTKDALTEVARAEIKAWYTQMLGRDLSAGEEKAVASLAKVITEEAA